MDQEDFDQVTVHTGPQERVFREPASVEGPTPLVRQLAAPGMYTTPVGHDREAIPLAGRELAIGCVAYDKAKPTRELALTPSPRASDRKSGQGAHEAKVPAKDFTPATNYQTPAHRRSQSRGRRPQYYTPSPQDPEVQARSSSSGARPKTYTEASYMHPNISKGKANKHKRQNSAVNNSQSPSTSGTAEVAVVDLTTATETEQIEHALELSKKYMPRTDTSDSSPDITTSQARRSDIQVIHNANRLYLGRHYTV